MHDESKEFKVLSAIPMIGGLRKRKIGLFYRVLPEVSKTSPLKKMLDFNQK